jgi:hypothetical protein
MATLVFLCVSPSLYASAVIYRRAAEVAEKIQVREPHSKVML